VGELIAHGWLLSAAGSLGWVQRRATLGSVPALRRDGPIRPRKLGHIVVGAPAADASQRLFVDGIGFKIRDQVSGVAALMWCSTDTHHIEADARMRIDFLA
jgi:hypothetical protein